MMIMMTEYSAVNVRTKKKTEKDRAIRVCRVCLNFGKNWISQMEPRNCFHNTKLLGTTHSYSRELAHSLASSPSSPYPNDWKYWNDARQQREYNVCIFPSLRQWIFRVSSFFSGSQSPLRSLCHSQYYFFIIYFSTHLYLPWSAVSVALFFPLLSNFIHLP